MDFSVYSGVFFCVFIFSGTAKRPNDGNAERESERLCLCVRTLQGDGDTAEARNVQ